jgi:CheY-like chemotaxis protein
MPETNSSPAVDRPPLALIIEDDDKLAMIYVEALHQAGFETAVIHDGAVALEQLTTLCPDLIVLDLHLPYVPGDKILSRIRQVECLAQTQVIVTTADAVRAARLRDQVDAILIKPISFLQLRELARRIRESLA